MKYETVKRIFTTVIAILLIVLVFMSMTGCNKQLVDLTYSYEYAVISLPNGDVIEGDVDSWIDFEDGDQIQVKIDGVTYLVHSTNIVLISN